MPAEPSPARTVVRLRVIGALSAALFSLMFVRLWYLQVLDTQGFAQTVIQNAVRKVEVPAPRGLILDRSGGVMVGNQATREITLSRVSAQQHPYVEGQLAALLNISPAQIQADLSNVQNSPYKPVPIMQNAPMPYVLYIGEHAAQFPGVSVTTDTARTYPMGQTGVQMLGYVGQISSAELRARHFQGYQLGDLYGQTGVENQYQSVLRGKPGVQDVEVDAQGQVVGSLGKTQPLPGDNLVTNIDQGLEQTLQQALDSEIATLHSQEGAAVALDPRTGAVLALVSSPTYDPTWWTPYGITEAHYQQLQSSGSLNDWAIDGLFPPGSTFKLATATAALQDGLWSPNEYYDDKGYFSINGCTVGAPGCSIYHDAPGESGGLFDISQALTVSSDDFFYNIGVNFWNDYKANGKYGETPIQDAANALSYGEVTGIDLPGETQYARVDSPQVVAKEHAQNPKAYPDGQWFTGNNLEMAFGQGGTVVTPIEAAVAYATFANGGTRYAPEIGAGITNPVTGKVLERVAPKVTGHVSYSPANYQAILSGLEGVVQSPQGTAYAPFQGFPLSSFPLAGKTGTASVTGQQPNSWFVGFGPEPNPKYVVVAVIQGGGYGEAAAAPVVRQAFNYIVAHPPAPTELGAPSPPATRTTACLFATVRTTTPGAGAVATPSTGSGAVVATTTDLCAPAGETPAGFPATTRSRPDPAVGRAAARVPTNRPRMATARSP